MRLTLRTLLAYLDDILEPAEAKEIGAKITESGFASILINRIREVTRRRRLNAPDLEGPGNGLDPNTVAEYLDCTLPPDSVADVEKVCLESDMHLAEVAASHQILTLALGEPVQVIPESREKMYALGPITKSSEALRAVAAIEPEPAAMVNAASMSTRPQPEDVAGTVTRASFEESIPDYLKPRPVWRRALPYTAALTVGLIWVGLLLYESPLVLFSNGQEYRPLSSEKGDERGGDPRIAAIEKRDDRFSTTISDIPPSITKSVVDGVVKGGAVSPLKQHSVDLPPPADEREAGEPIVDGKPLIDQIPFAGGTDLKPETESGPPQKEVVSSTPTLPKPKAEERPVVEPIEAPLAVVPVAGPTLQYDSPGGILLRYDDAKQDWLVMPHRAVIQAGERFVSPEPFDAEIDIGNGLCRATLLGGTAAHLLPPTETTAVGLAIEQGRVVLQNRSAANADGSDGQIPLTIAVHGEVWTLKLLNPGTLCGIDITPALPHHFEQDLGRNTFTGGVFVVSGSIEFDDGSGAVTLNSREWLSLTPRDRAAEKTAQNPVAVLPLLSIPHWLDLDVKQRSRSWRRYSALFEKEFDAEAPLAENVPPMIKDPRPYISALAVKCLALTGDAASLVSGLSSAHEESRMTAIIGLRTWLPTAQANGAQLKTMLAESFPNDDAETLYRLLWGFNQEDAKDAAQSAELVSWLNRSNITVRELAFYHVYRLTGRKYDYRPLLTPSKRKSTYNRWVEHVNREGGLIRQ